MYNKFLLKHWNFINFILDETIYRNLWLEFLHRSPIVAKCDRKRVLSSWAPYCGNVVPVEFHLEFRHVRHLSPQQFVERLSKELKVRGVVAGILFPHTEIPSCVLSNLMICTECSDLEFIRIISDMAALLLI